ncbi:MAG: MFS transporter [Desulfobacterales bacterium]|jgi:sugar phosphate permease
MRTLHNSASKHSTADFHRWVVFAVFSAVYFFVYFHRVSTSVVAPDLMDAFDTHATALGFMSSMYFYAYAFEQPIVGYLSDRLGPRRVVGCWSLIAAAGCIIFGLAPSIAWASVGRGLIGIGVGGVYVPALKAFSQWFRQKEFTTLTGFLMAIGNMGAIMATTPLAWSAKIWGWRFSFFGIAAITLLLALITLLLVRDYETTTDGNDEHHSTLPQDALSDHNQTRFILTSIKFWILFVIFFGVYGIFLTLQGLWATPYLMSVLQVDRLSASHLNMVLPVGFMIGAPLFGWFADRSSAKKIRLFNGLLATLMLMWLILALGAQTLKAQGLIILFLIMGTATGGWLATLWSLIRETAPLTITGSISGWLNPSPFLGIAFFQVLTGAILDRSAPIVGRGYPVAAFQKVFGVCFLAAVICLILSLVFKKQLARKAYPDS